MNIAEYYPSIDDGPDGAIESEQPCIDGRCAESIAKFLLDPERVKAATTSLEQAEETKTESALDIYNRDKGKPEHTFIGRIN